MIIKNYAPFYAGLLPHLGMHYGPTKQLAELHAVLRAVFGRNLPLWGEA